MAISTLADYASALRQILRFQKASQTVSFASRWNNWNFSGGVPASNTSAGNSANGVVPASGDAGYPVIQPTSGSAHLTRVEGSCAVASIRVMIYDRLFWCGGYNCNAGSQSLSSQPSFSGRLPTGSYAGLQLWLENTSNGNASNYTPTVTYMNEAGTSGQTTSVTAPNASGSAGNQLFQFPLAAGDKGVQKIESVATSAGPSGTYNLFIARPLFSFYIPAAGPQYVFPIEVVGAPMIYDTSALCAMMNAPVAAISGFEMALEVASK